MKVEQWAKKEVTRQDRTRLRELTERVAEIAAGEETRERIRLWSKHNRLAGERPMILVFPEGGWREILPDLDTRLLCRDPDLRPLEESLLKQIYTREHFKSDNVVDAYIPVRKTIHHSGWGLQEEWEYSDMEAGARAFKPVLKDRSDLDRLHFPVVSHDEDASRAEFEFYQELLGDLLTVRLVGVQHVSFHLYNQFTAWHGLEQTFLDLIVEPAFVHDALSLLRDGHQRMIDQYIQQDLLDLNNDNTYQSTGGNGWTDELPPPDCDPRHVRPRDMWASAETQEFAPVSPAMHEEFALAYERPLLEPFGLAGYGCCDPLHDKLDMVLSIPNIRRISVSPSADVDKTAERLGNRAIFSWKPQPAHLVGDFDDGHIRGYLDHTIEVCRSCGCTLEIILKDTHGCDKHPERFDRWSAIASEAINRKA